MTILLAGYLLLAAAAMLMTFGLCWTASRADKIRAGTERQANPRPSSPATTPVPARNKGTAGPTDAPSHPDPIAGDHAAATQGQTASPATPSERPRRGGFPAQRGEAQEV